MIILGIPLEAWVAAVVAVISMAVGAFAAFRKKKFATQEAIKVVESTVDIAMGLKDAYDKQKEAEEQADKIYEEAEKKLGQPLSTAQKTAVRRKILKG